MEFLNFFLQGREVVLTKEGIVLKILDKVFTDRYYRIKKFEQDGEIYKKIGVDKFKRILLRSAITRRNEVPFKNYFLNSLSKKGLIEFKNRTKKSERNHVILGVIFLIYQFRIIIYMEGIVDFAFFILFSVLNIVLNLYPIFLQRYTRSRIERILKE